MENKRKFLRLEVSDFLEIRTLKSDGKKVEAKAFNLTLLGICFSSQMFWESGETLFIEYFIPEEIDSVKLKAKVVWSELISDEIGYLTGCELFDIEQTKELRFVNYYFQKLKNKFMT